MKKIVVSALVMLLFIGVVGCTKKEEKNVDGWELIMHQSTEFLDEDLKDAFSSASSSYTSEKFNLISLLGELVFAGKNYMLLCQSENGYKIVVLYRDLEGNSSFTHINDFDFKKYVNENISLKQEESVGGWETIIPGKPIMLEENAQYAFDTATSKLVGVTYYPIAVLAKENKSGVNYAMMCYGRMSDKNGTTGVYLLTINVDENNTSEIVSIAGIDLSNYNN